jgi:hypothetical protein
VVRSLNFEWNRGFIRVTLKRGLYIEAENAKIELMQREVEVKGPFMNYEEHIINRRSEKKVIYVNFAFQIKGISINKAKDLILSNGDFSMGPFGISYTKLDGLGSYLTIYTPPGFLYETAVLSKEKLALFTIGRRQVFLLDEGTGVKKILLL